MDGQDGGHLEHHQDFIARSAFMKRSANVPPRAFRI
jgi:hypothetical protein